MKLNNYFSCFLYFSSYLSNIRNTRGKIFCIILSFAEHDPQKFTFYWVA